MIYRLPVFQASAGGFIPPIVSIMATPRWACHVQEEEQINQYNATINMTTMIMDHGEFIEPWRERVNMVNVYSLRTLTTNTSNARNLI